MKNMLKYDTVKGIEPSKPEKILGNKLSEYGQIYEREVVFEKCINPITGKGLRFDFYIPGLKVLIEYDGLGYHDDPETKYRDKLKNAFAKANGLTLYRITGTRNIKHLLEDRMGLKLADVKPKKLISEFNRLRDLENRKKYYKGYKKRKKKFKR